MQLLHSSIEPVAIVQLQHLTIFVSTNDEHEANTMAYYNDISQRSDLVERLLGNAARFFETAAARRAVRRTYRVTLAELQTLSNRELADLGLHRSELRRIAWQSAHGETDR